MEGRNVQLRNVQMLARPTPLKKSHAQSVSLTESDDVSVMDNAWNVE